MPHTIRTERLLLRPPSLRDARALALGLNDLRVLRNTGTWAYPLTQEGALFRIRHIMKMTPLADHVFAICRGDDFIGTCGIHRQTTGRYSVGYMLAQPFWGRGYATEALRAVCQFGFRVCGAQILWGDAFIANPASCHVMEKVGMRFTKNDTAWSAALGQRLPSKQYEMTRTEFRP